MPLYIAIVPRFEGVYQVFQPAIFKLNNAIAILANDPVMMSILDDRIYGFIAGICEVLQGWADIAQACKEVQRAIHRHPANLGINLLRVGPDVIGAQVRMGMVRQHLCNNPARHGVFVSSLMKQRLDGWHVAVYPSIYNPVSTIVLPTKRGVSLPPFDNGLLLCGATPSAIHKVRLWQVLVCVFLS